MKATTYILETLLARGRWQTLRAYEETELDRATVAAKALSEGGHTTRLVQTCKTLQCMWVDGKEKEVGDMSP